MNKLSLSDSHGADSDIRAKRNDISRSDPGRSQTPIEQQTKIRSDKEYQSVMQHWKGKSHSKLRMTMEIRREFDGYSTEYPRIAIEPIDLEHTDIQKAPSPKSQKVMSDNELLQASRLLLEALDIRKKYCFGSIYHHRDEPREPVSSLFDTKNVPSDDPQYKVQFDKGITSVWKGNESVTSVSDLDTFLSDFDKLLGIVNSGPCKSYTYKRLKALENKYNMYILMNDAFERMGIMSDPQDFSTVIKVDTHVHLAAGMTPLHLLEFIKQKAKTSANEPVMELKDGHKITLQALFDKYSLDPQNLTVTMLDVIADNTFQRFDNFNSKYNPFGMAELRTVFLKSDNYVQGKYFAELTREIFDRLEQAKYLKTEFRISIYGRNTKEWTDLASWVVDNKLYSETNRWLIQVPRIYDVLKKGNAIQSFGELLRNIFVPLFEVTLNPSKDPKLFLLLKQVSGFDSVDDESKLEGKMPSKWDGVVYPEDWISTDNPPYAYYMYFMWANVKALNQLRKLKELNTFDFRPHSGEAGSEDHLAAAFMLANAINHGINLEKNTTLQYLYYLTQIGIAVSPLSNNALFLDYKRNPFPLFFKRGLNVSLSTDDPLLFHLTQDPLLEEYAIASKRWRFTETDLAEIARNSVLQSGFEHERKAEWLGPQYHLPGPDSNDISFTNIPAIRAHYRWETLQEEYNTLHQITQSRPLRISISYPNNAPIVGAEDIRACLQLKEAIDLRRKYVFVPSNTFHNYNLFHINLENSNANPPVDNNAGTPTKPTEFPVASEHEVRLRDGVYLVYKSSKVLCSFCSDDVASVECPSCGVQYCSQCDYVLHKPAKTKAHIRRVYDAVTPVVNIHSVQEFVKDLETMEHIRMSPSAQSFAEKELLLLEMKFNLHELLNREFEKEEMKDYVIVQNGSPVKLGDFFSQFDVPLENLTLDTLDMKATNTFNRFDKFKNTYNPLGRSELRQIFLKKDGYLKGRYFAELMKQVLTKFEESKYVKVEYRISIYGRTKNDWNDFADWLLDNNIMFECNRWVIQVPRIYHIFKESKDVSTFQDFLDNIFQPLFEVTRDPSSNPRLHSILDQISGFDSVDDEHTPPANEFNFATPPQDWDFAQNPPYNYYIYYMWANITSLNQFREMKGLNTFEFKPHCGVVGSRSHLSATFLTANGITHGINLTKEPTMEFLFYLDQIPINMSPLSEDALYIAYEKNPFVTFFKRGLNVSLSTDNPLQIHTTDEPLMEEYSVGHKMWKLSICDLSEIARNSVLHSGFKHELKAKWVGKNYHIPGPKGNDPERTNVPDLRVLFRTETLAYERDFVQKVIRHLGSQAPPEDASLLHDSYIYEPLSKKDKPQLKFRASKDDDSASDSEECHEPAPFIAPSVASSEPLHLQKHTNNSLNQLQSSVEFLQTALFVVTGVTAMLAAAILFKGTK